MLGVGMTSPNLYSAMLSAKKPKRIVIPAGGCGQVTARAGICLIEERKLARVQGRLMFNEAADSCSHAYLRTWQAGMTTTGEIRTSLSGFGFKRMIQPTTNPSLLKHIIGRAHVFQTHAIGIPSLRGNAVMTYTSPDLRTVAPACRRHGST